MVPQSNALTHFHEFSDIDSEQESKSDPGLSKHVVRNQMDRPTVKHDISSIESIENSEKATKRESRNDKILVEPRATFKNSTKPTLKLQRCPLETTEQQALCDELDTSPRLNIPNTQMT